jgi:hypothetical protein
MGRVADLLGAARTSRRRRMKLREPRTGDMLLYAWLVVVILVRFTMNCTLAFRQLTRGDPRVGTVIAGFTFLHLLIVVVLLTFLSSTLSLGADGLNRRRITLMGIPFGTRIAAELAGLVAHPMTGVVLLFLIPALLPVFALPHPAGVVVALVAAFAGALLGASALGQALSLRKTAHRIAGGFRFLFAAVMLGLVAANFDFRWDGGRVSVLVFQKPFLLDEGGLLSGMGPWSPSVWILKGWIAPCFGLLMVCLGCWVLALRGAEAASGSHATSAGTMGARVAGRDADVRTLLLRRELRQLVFSPGGFLAFAAGIGSCLWLLTAREPTLGIPLLGCAVIVLAGFGAAANLFGRDGHALKRYALLNVEWRMIFGAKNGAWLIVSAASMAPAVAAAAIRIGAASGAALLLAAALALSLCTLWGNLSSILLPSRNGGRQPFVNQLAPFVICAIPLGIHRTVAGFGSIGFDAAILACLMASMVLHARLRALISRTFDAELESVMERFEAS